MRPLVWTSKGGCLDKKEIHSSSSFLISMGRGAMYETHIGDKSYL